MQQPMFAKQSQAHGRKILRLDLDKYTPAAYAALVTEARKHGIEVIDKNDKVEPIVTQPVRKQPMMKQAKKLGWNVVKNNGTIIMEKGV